MKNDKQTVLKLKSYFLLLDGALWKVKNNHKVISFIAMVLSDSLKICFEFCAIFVPFSFMLIYATINLKQMKYYQCVNERKACYISVNLIIKQLANAIFFQVTLSNQSVKSGGS